MVGGDCDEMHIFMRVNSSLLFYIWQHFYNGPTSVSGFLQNETSVVSGSQQVTAQMPECLFTNV